MDRLIEQPAVTPERRRIVAAWEALERAEALLPHDHPAAWHLVLALAALEAHWRAQLPGHDQGHAAHDPADASHYPAAPDAQGPGEPVPTQPAPVLVPPYVAAAGSSGGRAAPAAFRPALRQCRQAALPVPRAV